MTNQLANGIWTDFERTQNPFVGPNAMAENLRLIDDHLAPWTRTDVLRADSDYIAAPYAGEALLFDNGTYAVYNAGAWRRYPASLGTDVLDARDGTQFSWDGHAWRNRLRAMAGADGASLIGFTQGDEEALERTMLSKARDIVSSSDYRTLQGAINAAIRRGAKLGLEPGTLIPQVVIDRPLYMTSRGTVASKYGGRSGPHIHVAPGADGSVLRFGTLDYQGVGQMGILLDAAYCNVHVGCAQNMVAQDYAIANRQGVVIVQSNNNIVDVFARNFSLGNTGGANAVPRIITTERAAARNVIRARAYQTHTVWIDNGTDNHAEFVIADSVTDNGIYNLSDSLRMTCDFLRYTNSKEEAYVFEGAFPTIGKVVQDGWSYPGVQNCRGAEIGEIVLFPSPDGTPSTCAIRSRDGNVRSDIRIGRISGALAVNGVTAYDVGALLHFYVGNVDLRVGAIDLRVKWTGTSTARYFIVHRFGSVAEYGSVRLTFDDSEGRPTEPMYWQRPAGIRFVLGPECLDVDARDYTWLKVSDVNNTNVILPFGQEIVGSVFQNPSLQYPCARVVYATAAPTSGTWNRGDAVFNKFPYSGGATGWKCIASGAPGTWRLLGQAGIGKGITRPNPASLGLSSEADMVGAEHLDTSLAAGGRFIKHNGTQWVDAMGTVV